MCEGHAPPTIGFCAEHGEMAKAWTRAEFILDSTRQIVQDLHDSVMPLLQGTDSYPVVLKRMADLEEGHRKQLAISEQTAATLQGVQTALAAKAEERIGKLDRGTKILVAWLALGGTFLASIILTAGQIFIALYK